MSGVSSPDSKSAGIFVQGSGLGMSYLLNLAISEIWGFEKCKLIFRLTISWVFGSDKCGGEGRKIIWSGEWGRKAEKSYGLGSGPTVQKK